MSEKTVIDEQLSIWDSRIRRSVVWIMVVVAIVVGISMLLPTGRTFAGNSAPTVEHDSHTPSQYVESWIEEITGVADSVTKYSDALALQYAQPWLDARRERICNRSLDMMYACQNGFNP